MGEFIDLVAEMRHAQKEYFRSKSKPALAKSKRLEKRVDRRLLELKGVVSRQAGLFEEDGAA